MQSGGHDGLHRKIGGALLLEEELDATWSETPPASQPVFCGSSLQDTPSCQAVPRASTELRGMEQQGRRLS